MFPFFQFGELIIRHNTLVSAYICMENGFDELVCNEFVDHFSPLLLLLLTLASFRRCSRAKKRNLIKAPITIMIRISKTAQTMPILVPAAKTEIVMFYFGKSLKERWSSLV